MALNSINKSESSMVEQHTFSSRLFDVFLTIIMFLMSILFLYPFLYVLFYSVSDVSRNPLPILLYPVGINFISFDAILSANTTIRSIFITIARCTIGPLAMIIVCGMGGYTLSRDKLIFGRAIRIYLIFSMYVGAGMVPGSILFSKIGLLNNFWVYILPGMVSIFNMILIKAYIMGIPNELVESVRIDGGTEFDVYFRVILPLSIPVNAALVLFSIIGHWNSYFDAALYNGTNPDLWPLALRLWIQLKSATVSLEELQQLAREGKAVKVDNTNINMAMTVITTLPIICIYPLLRKYFASGLLIGSVKM